MRPTYKVQYDKIIDAYFKNEIKPYDRQFCFCGTIGIVKKYLLINWSFELYRADQYNKMEEALLNTLTQETVGLTFCNKYGFILQSTLSANERYDHGRKLIESHPNYENALFNGMCAALEVLKQIHIEGGEVIDDVPTFTKRQPQTI